jgi:hypothetical protein
MESKKDEISRVCSTHEKKRNAYRTLVGKPEERVGFEVFVAVVMKSQFSIRQRSGSS